MITSPDNLYSPDSADGYDLIADWATSMDSVQDALNSRNALSGIASARPTAGVAGRRWYSTDTDVSWIDDGTDWLPTSWTTYTPTWAAATTAPALNNGTLLGRYRYTDIHTVELRVMLTFGSSTTGGAGAYTFTLPSGVSGQTAGEQIVSAKTYQATINRNYWGYAQVATGSPTLLRPHFPVGPEVSDYAAMQNANSGGGSSTGVPVVTGNYSYLSGSTLVIQGFIEVS
jgi:hypothetical protein